MLRELLLRLKENQDYRSFFYSGEIFIVVVFALGIWWLRPKGPESQFKVRESDLRKPKPKCGPNSRPSERDELAEARIKRQAPLQLEGIRIDGKPHEILGVSANSSPQQIQQAYRELMKRYHPDRVGPPGSREWADAQRIAEAINRAKDALLKK